MSVPAPTAELDTRFSSPNATARPWSDVVDALERAEIFWLSTVRRDGRPHVTPLPAMWLEGSLYFCTGPDEQKAKNIEANPHCVLTTGNDRFRSGLDVVVEGSAVRTLDDSLLRRLAAIWTSKLEWAFSAAGHSGTNRCPTDGGCVHAHERAQLRPSSANIGAAPANPGSRGALSRSRRSLAPRHGRAERARRHEPEAQPERCASAPIGILVPTRERRATLPSARSLFSDRCILYDGATVCVIR